MNRDLVHLPSAVRARLARLGANTAHAAAAARVPPSDELSTEQFFTFWEALGASSPPDVGLRLATETQVHEYDIASLAALHSPDLGTALAKLARYKRLCGLKDMAIDTKGKEVAIHTTYHHAPGPMPPRLVDASLASLLVLLQRGSGLALAPKRVELTRARSDEPMLMRFFGCPLRFRAERDALVLDERLLSTPFVTHNADLLQVLLPSLDQKLAPLEQGSLVEQVRAVVARRMSGERPSLAKVARELSLSTRTLQRRLGELGVSYQHVLDDVRHHTALRLLRKEDVDVNEIAFLLGFDEVNSFTRAFRAWEGTTPHRWRDSISLWRDRI
ncbi:AraC family transcriptional regulator ligand-binding domain-containing protein [Polyangium sorediatum]|uniref:AraC family transcriptional regulator ligand-binding domain-containing protein n=1 Tax=Polyangium sorediatum TaxID=889274 RepID=A0ABT6NMR9_9BACT|nr:AraC family transcriptional regulator [Polyangium sorediatum]MDI1429622.1 AraC family transcriptional regulator ligand-binding domain-containing protein [Polyangium sorediatum]